MATKKSRKHISHDRTHIKIKKGLVGYSILVFLFFLLITLSAFTVIELAKDIRTHERREALVALNKQLDLGDSYTLDELDPTEYDEETNAGAISLAYGRDASRNDTFDELRRKLTEAGFGRYNSSSVFPDDDRFRVDEYKNKDGVEISVWIDTAAYRNASIYGTAVDDPNSAAQTNDAPVYVMMHVEFDDD